MSSIFTELKSELRRLMIAGGDLSKGDVRLKKLLPMLEKGGETAPVLKKLAGQTEELTKDDNKNRCYSLLEESTLLNAVLYTQAKTGLEGTLTALNDTDAYTFMDVHYRDASELITALTTKGPDRYPVINRGLKEGFIKDIRFMPYVVNGLNDSYSEIPPLVAKVIPCYGNAALDLLLKDFDMSKGTESNIHRFNVIASIMGEQGKEFFYDIYKNAQTKLKPHALVALSVFPEYEHLFEDAIKSKNYDLKYSGFVAFTRKNDSDSLTLLKNAIESTDKNTYKAVVDAILKTDLKDKVDLIINYFDAVIESKKADDKFKDILYSAHEILDVNRIHAILEILDIVHNVGDRYLIIQLIYLLLEDENLDKGIDILVSYVRQIVKKDKNNNLIDNIDYIISSSIDKLTPQRFYQLYFPLVSNKFIFEKIKEQLLNRIHVVYIEKSSDEKIKLDEGWSDTIIHQYPELIACIAKPGMNDAVVALKNYLNTAKFESSDDFKAFDYFMLGMDKLGEKDFLPEVLDILEKALTNTAFIEKSMQRNNYYFWYYVIDGISPLIVQDSKRFLDIFKSIKKQIEEKTKKPSNTYLDSIIDELENNSKQTENV